MEPPCKTIVIKLGGSSITAKSENQFATRDPVIHSSLAQIAHFLHKSAIRPRILLVCGVGPFGHSNVINFDLTRAVVTPRQREGVVVTNTACDHVGTVVTAHAVSLGLPAVFVPGHNVATQNDRRVTKFDVGVYESLLNNGKIPVSTGCMVPDTSLLFSVMSGDEFVAQFALLLKPELILLGTNVPGIFTSDPNLDAHAKGIPLITRENVEGVLEG
ncbi:hypothetical protein HDU98_003496, partial [Podochytrium sp. JEL0797]